MGLSRRAAAWSAAPPACYDPDLMDTVTLTIDGRTITAEKGKSVLQAAIENGISVPYYCYHPGIGVDGSCRMCIVKVEKMPKLQTSCSTLCAEGMVVTTNSPEVVAARASVFEFLLINHPLDCPVCDKGGECPLQDFSYTFGPAESRMEFPRRTFDGEGVKADVDFGPTLMLNRNRCILCTRCVRFMRDVEGDAQINVIDRGNGSEIATFQDEGVHSLNSGNLMDVCPVGAITTRDYRFKARPWDNPHAVDTICTFCSKGCNTTAWIKEKPEWVKSARLIRFTPRFNPAVNELLDVRHRPLRVSLDRRRSAPAPAARALRRRRAAGAAVDRRDGQARRPARRGRRREPRRRALPALGARVERRAVPLQAPHRIARRRRRGAAPRRSRGATAPRRSRRARSSRCRPSTRRTSTARSSSAWRPPGPRPPTRISRRSSRRSRPDASPRSTSSIPDPRARSATPPGSSTRGRAARCRCSSCRAS